MSIESKDGPPIYLDHLGSFYPYYTYRGDNLLVSTKLEEFCGGALDHITIDPIAVIEILTKNYMLGDRTILKGVYRSPWMTRLGEKAHEIDQIQIPPHGIVEKSADDIAGILYDLLRMEIRSYISGCENIGLLLSGGMDSRMVAGVLYNLIKSSDVKVKKVTAYTWGQSDSRDVVYAREIANLLEWDWKHFQVNAEDLWQNIKIAGERGCEYTGLHLHGMPQIAQENDCDVILAASYGDSIGRGEYSGNHLTELKQIGSDISNRKAAFLIKDQVFRRYSGAWIQDVERYHNWFHSETVYEQNEKDYQLHYMRRMLNPCMEVINENIPLRQVFTHPEVFGFMWSIHPKMRNDDVYRYLLHRFVPELINIPWARKGVIYGKTSNKVDLYTKKHHIYPMYIQRDLIDEIEERLLTHSGLRNSIFNMHSVEKLLKLVRRKPNFNFDYLEKITWLVSFTFFLDKYNIDVKYSKFNSILDRINGDVLLHLQYIVLHRLRNLRKILRG